MSQYPKKTIREILNDYLNAVQRAIKSNMAARGRNASNKSVKSLRNEIVGDDRAILWGESSFLVMERGRRSGKVPYGFVNIIRQWILDKGISVRPIPAKTARAKISPQERGLRSMSWLIANKIRTSGTRLHRMGGYDDIFTSAIEKQMASFEKDVINWASVEIDRIHQKENETFQLQ